MRSIWRLIVFLGISNAGPEEHNPGVIAQFPPQFSADLQITAHLVDRSRQYPSSLRAMEVYYDLEGGRVKVVVKDGIDAGKTFIRLYESKAEYVLFEGKFARCRRSYLGESMPVPQLPLTATFEGMVSVEGWTCEHWVQEDVASRVHVYIDKASKVPRRLVDEAVVAGAAGVPLLTFDFREVTIGPQAPQLFDLPERYSSKDACDLHVGGFPYFHLFHHYLRA